MTSPTKQEPVRHYEVPAEMMEQIFSVLMYYANYTSYDAPRTGGVLKGCPRGEKPTGVELSMSARWMIRDIEQNLMKRPSWVTAEEIAPLDAMRATVSALQATVAERDARVKELEGRVEALEVYVRAADQYMTVSGGLTGGERLRLAQEARALLSPGEAKEQL